MWKISVGVFPVLKAGQRQESKAIIETNRFSTFGFASAGQPVATPLCMSCHISHFHTISPQSCD